jgi:hypothetical protein
METSKAHFCDHCFWQATSEKETLTDSTTMFHFKLSIFALLSVGCYAQALRPVASRNLLEAIAGYVPTTLVTDQVSPAFERWDTLVGSIHNLICPIRNLHQNAIDQDERTMELILAALTDEAFALAQKIYSNGGNSGSYAKLTLTTPISTTPLPKAGDTVAGVNSAGAAVSGKVSEAYIAGSTSLSVAYDVSDVQVTHSSCRVGGLNVTLTTGCKLFHSVGSHTIGPMLFRRPHNSCFLMLSLPPVSGLAPNGNIKINNGPNIAYSYSVASDNLNSRTLKSLSTTSASLHTNAAGKYYPYYQKFIDYYGDTAYVDKIVTAAFTATSVTLKNTVFDFVNHPRAARERTWPLNLHETLRLLKAVAFVRLTEQFLLSSLTEAILKTSAFTNLVMVVIGYLERAIENCEANRESLSSLDLAVAYYTGSLEGVDGSGQGYALHNHADRRCPGYKACGINRDATNGTSKINFVMADVFKSMKDSLAAKNCAAAKATANTGMPTLLIPQIQGALRYTRILASRVNYTGHEGAEAEGAAFAAGVLPMIAACNPAAAATIWSNLRIKVAKPPDLVAVKAAFESTYKCLGITCAEVGGQWNVTVYYPNAGPCVDVVAPAPSAAAPSATKAPTVTAPSAPKAPAAPPAAAPSAKPSKDGPLRRLFKGIRKFFRNIFG